ELMSAELLRIWSADTKTVLFITHQLDEAVYLADRVVVLAAHPGTVREIVEIPFGRPRDLALKRSPDFGEIVAHIWGLIEDEVKSSFRN
ncbi:MAG: ABC transporter ATP-binding protein, partial [Propionibacteriaceae bacterium]|nr:ABC transporter ATP-binding protein [Propionibacteriaceae bacterium]